MMRSSGMTCCMDVGPSIKPGGAGSKPVLGGGFRGEGRIQIKDTNVPRTGKIAEQRHLMLAKGVRA